MHSGQINDKAILIIGGNGRMGRMLEEKGKKKGLCITSIDQPLTQTVLSEHAPKADIAVFCVPVLVFEEVLQKVCPYLQKTCIVSDITSVKTRPMWLMRKYWNGAIVGTHPLFGPKHEENAPLPVAVTKDDRADKESLETITAFFTALGFQTFLCTPKEHDEAMAQIQNLNFITNLAYFALLANHEELLPYLTPSFIRRLNAAKKMLTEDATMFTGLFEANDSSQSVVRKYQKLLNLAASGDIGVLCQKVRWWWDTDRC